MARQEEVIDVDDDDDDDADTKPPAAKRKRLIIHLIKDDEDTLPILPFYLNKVHGLSPIANRQCLSLEDIVAGGFTDALLVSHSQINNHWSQQDIISV